MGALHPELHYTRFVIRLNCFILVNKPANFNIFLTETVSVLVQLTGLIFPLSILVKPWLRTCLHLRDFSLPL